MLLELQGRKILVDPMLGPKGSLPPFTLLRFRPRWNPLVDLPVKTDSLLKNVEGCLVTHSRALNLRFLQHLDHLDPKGEKFLRERNIPVACPAEPSLYISGDTVLTDEVRRVLVTERPEVAVVAAGGAQLDVGGKLLMSEQDLLEFVELAPGLVVANHMDALNHCPMTRERLRKALDKRGLLEKVLIPEDGECVEV